MPLIYRKEQKWLNAQLVVPPIVQKPNFVLGVGRNYGLNQRFYRVLAATRLIGLELSFASDAVSY